MDPPAVDDVLRVQQATNHATIMASTTCDKAYTSEYNRFVAWVQNQPYLGTQEAPFLTKTNVEHYFSTVIACRHGCPNTIGRVLNSLEWYASHREHVGTQPAFVVRTDIVETALKTQKAFNKSSGGTANLGSDPHKGLKDILPENSRIRFMRHIYRNRRDWGPASVNFTWGHNAAIRGASCNKMGFCDLNTSIGFGPNDDGTEPATGLVHRKGPVHKDKHETDKQVFVWRHKNYLLCSVFATAAYVIHKITENPNINFLHANKNERASWWDTPLIDWNNYNGE